MLFKGMSDHSPWLKNTKNVILFKMRHVVNGSDGNVKGQRLVFRLYRDKVAPIFLKMAVYCSSTFENSEKEQFALPSMSPSYVFI